MHHEVIVNEKLQVLQAEENRKSKDLDKSIKELEEDFQARLLDMEKVRRISRWECITVVHFPNQLYLHHISLLL